MNDPSLLRNATDRVVRPAALLLALLFAIGVAAGEQAVRGPEVLLGDPTLAPIAGPNTSGTTAAMATDGDEVVLVWTGRSSLYAQRLDRDGRRATELPKLLMAGTRSGPAVATPLRTFHAAGLYWIFFNRLENQQWTTWAMRLTR